jgi:hypothetical protein
MYTHTLNYTHTNKRSPDCHSVYVHRARARERAIEPASERETVKSLVALARPRAQDCRRDLHHPLSCAETNASLRYEGFLKMCVALGEACLFGRAKLPCCVCVYVCVCLCLCLCVFVIIHIHIYRHTPAEPCALAQAPPPVTPMPVDCCRGNPWGL